MTIGCINFKVQALLLWPLIVRYLAQARELEKLSGDAKVIKIEQCESSQTAELLKVLGYRMRGGCGSEVVLETLNASKAFVTIDSGFPVADLEQALEAVAEPQSVPAR